MSAGFACTKSKTLDYAGDFSWGREIQQTVLDRLIGALKQLLSGYTQMLSWLLWWLFPIPGRVAAWEMTVSWAAGRWMPGLFWFVEFLAI